MCELEIKGIKGQEKERKKREGKRREEKRRKGEDGRGKTILLPLPLAYAYLIICQQHNLSVFFPVSHSSEISMPLATVAFSLHLYVHLHLYFYLYMFPIFSLLSCSSIGHWSDEGVRAILHSTVQHSMT
jgi:hypothetical protein